MSTLMTRVKVQGLAPGLFGSAAAEATTIDQGNGRVRELFNAGPDRLYVHAVVATDNGHELADPITVEPGDRHTINARSKLASPGEANVVVSEPR